jgi:hypothetical protein
MYEVLNNNEESLPVELNNTTVKISPREMEIWQLLKNNVIKRLIYKTKSAQDKASTLCTLIQYSARNLSQIHKARERNKSEAIKKVINHIIPICK